MDDKLRDELKAEYTILQGHYEGFDTRSLTIKSLSAPLLAGGIGVGFSQDSIFLILAVVVVCLCLWALEAIWKSFQYCYSDRIKLIEDWFRTGSPASIAPFQIFHAWGEVWRRYYKYPKAWIKVMMQPFVLIPYFPIASL